MQQCCYSKLFVTGLNTINQLSHHPQKRNLSSMRPRKRSRDETESFSKRRLTAFNPGSATLRLFQQLPKARQLRLSDSAASAVRALIEGTTERLVQAIVKNAATANRATVYISDVQAAIQTHTQLPTPRVVEKREEEDDDEDQEKEEEEEEEKTNWADQYLERMHAVVPKFFGPVLKDHLPFPRELVESVASWFGADDDPHVVTPFYVVRVYYNNHGTISTNLYSSVSTLMSAAAEHEAEIMQHMLETDWCLVPSEQNVTALIKQYFGCLKQQSQKVMTDEQVGYRWDSIFTGFHHL
jgi:histone H3/H4